MTIEQAVKHSHPSALFLGMRKLTLSWQWVRGQLTVKSPVPIMLILTSTSNRAGTGVAVVFKILEVSWGHLGDILGISWGNTGYIWDISWGYLEDIVRISWKYLGDICMSHMTK